MGMAQPKAPGASTAYAEPAQTSAKLVGWLNPNGATTSFYFQYGTTTAYGNTVPAPAATMSGTTPQLVAFNVGNLQPGTTYHFRLVATNAYGTTVGADQSFGTASGSPSASTAYAEAAETSAKLVGWLNPNGFTTSFQFQYGTTTAYGNSVPVPAATMSGTSSEIVAFNATNLQPGTTYHFRLLATNAYGTSVGADQTFTTTGPAYEVVGPGEVTQSKITMASKIDARGYAPTYYFEYGPNLNYGSKTQEKALPAGTGPQPVSSALEGLPVGWTVHYRIVVKSSAGTIYGPDQVVTTAWTNESSSAPSGSVSDSLADVSCPAAGNCVAVGTYTDAAATAKIAAQRWNGSSWAPITPPAPAGTSQLEGVSCPSTTSCLAVGNAVASGQAPRPLVMRWNGSAWSELSLGSALPAGYTHHLSDIDCPTATSCEAVGYSTPASGAEIVKTLALHFDGSAWTLRPSANPNTPGGEPSSEDNYLQAVSCATATFCKAVGSHTASLSGTLTAKPLIESLSGSEWASEAADLASYPGASGTQFWLQGVSCPTTGACLAVGSRQNGTDAGSKSSFTQRWNGTQWLDQRSGEYDLSPALAEVSCSSPSSCRAVGPGGLGLHWAGTRWRLQAPKPPADRGLGDPISLAGVACPTAFECHAVGSFSAKSTGTSQRLTQGWSGAGTAPAVSAPVAWWITNTKATLIGSVNPAGVDAGYYYEYGPTTSYGTKTPRIDSSENWGQDPKLWPQANVDLTGLQAGQKYHFRLVASNGATTTYSPDATFETKNSLGEMPVTEPFNATSSPVSDFATKWGPLQWTGAEHKGKNNANGYGPQDTAPNGAYFIPTVSDQGTGIASQMTIAAGPGAGGRVSLWLDMNFPTTTRSGYELRLQEESAGKYAVALKRWGAGLEKLLDSKTAVSLPAGATVALVDEGPSVAAYANTGSGYSKILGAAETLYSGGSAGVEVAGATTTRLTNFKLGLWIEKAPNFEEAQKAIPVTDGLRRNESPLYSSGSWAPLAWDTAAVKPGKTLLNTGWTSAESEGSTAIAGAYWKKATAADTGTGNAVLATNKVSLLLGGPHYFALWLNAPNPAAVKSGYQLRVMSTGYNTLEMKLLKWVSATATTLGTKTMTFSSQPGVRFALVDKGGTVSVYTAGPEQGLVSILSAADSTYSYGYAGVEGMGTLGLVDFKVGQLPLF
jgi:hypothetical protein